MANGLLIGEDSKIADWASSTFQRYPTRVDRALGIVGPDKKLIGAILLQNFNGVNIELSYYGPRTLSLGIVRAIGRIIVLEFNAARLTVVTTKKNKRLMRALQRFGFRLEGAQRRYFGHRDCSRNVGIRFVLFREEMNKILRIEAVLPEQKAE